MIKNNWLWVFLLCLGSAWFLLFLGHSPLIVPDEGRYVGIARDMLAHHEWVVPWMNGVPFFDKPIMYYWLEIVGLKLGGINEFGARLPQALMALSGALMTYHCAKRLFGSRSAVFAFIVLLVSPLYFLLAHYADMDLEVAVFISISMQGFILAQQADNTAWQTRWYMWLCYAAIGCAVLTKGFMGIIFPSMVAFSWMLWARQWQILKRLHLITGVAIVLAINLPWDLVMQQRFPDYWHYFFYQLQFGRYLTHSFTHIEPVWFYLPILLVGVLPVSLLALHRLRPAKSWLLLDQPHSINQAFFISWAAFILLFFSVAHTKLVGYIIPVVPAIAILAGMYFNKIWQRQQALNWANAGVASLGYLFFSAVFAVVPYCLPHLMNAVTAQYAASIASYYLVAGSVMLIAWSRKMPRLLLVASLLAVVLMNFTILVCPNLRRSNADAYHEAQHYIKPDTAVVMYQNYLYDASFYLQRRLLMVNDWNAAMPAFQDTWHWRMQYGAKQAPMSAKPWMIGSAEFEQLWHSKRPMVVFVDKGAYQRFASHRTPKPVAVIRRGGIVVATK